LLRSLCASFSNTFAPAAVHKQGCCSASASPASRLRFLFSCAAALRALSTSLRLASICRSSASALGLCPGSHAVPKSFSSSRVAKELCDEGALRQPPKSTVSDGRSGAGRRESCLFAPAALAAGCDGGCNGGCDGGCNGGCNGGCSSETVATVSVAAGRRRRHPLLLPVDSREDQQRWLARA